MNSTLNPAKANAETALNKHNASPKRPAETPAYATSSASTFAATSKTCVHAFGDDALADHDATAIAHLLHQRKLSPREVLEAAIQRAHKVEPAIHAIELAVFRQALRDANQPHAGFFAGVPTFVKDNTDIKGLPTSHGSDAVNAQPAKAHGSFAQQYMAQGFVLMGKSRMPEFGLNATTEFVGHLPTRNPWHIDYSCGASSGGSAALVAAGVVPIAHANDGGGSIRIPAACCGLIGLKPSRGRLIDSKASRALPVNIIGEGVVTRSVRDTAHFFAEAERYYYNPKMPRLGLIDGPGHRRLRVGLVVDSITGERTDAETRAAILTTATLLEDMGHAVEDMPLNIRQTFAQDFGIYWGMLSFAVEKFGKHIMSRQFDASSLDTLTKGLANLYRKNLLKTPLIVYRLKKIQQEYAALFARYDVVLSPVLAHTTPKLGYLAPDMPFDVLFDRLMRYVSFTPLNNVSGGPGISLPVGQSTQGLPIGAHFSARYGDERTLLEIAFALEQASPWRRIQDQ